MHFSLVVLASAIVSWLVTTLLTQPISTPRARWRARVLLAMRASDAAVVDTVSKILHSAHDPLSVKIDLLLECRCAQDAKGGQMPTPVLRSACRVKHVRCKPGGHARRLRRLVKHFLSGGDEDDFVLVVDPRAELVDGWDAALAHWMQACPDGSLLTAPAVKRQTDDARFPTLKLTEAGDVVRGPSRSFAACQDALVSLVPVVCWCPEWTAGRPRTFLHSWPSTTNAASEMPDALKHGTLMAPLAPLATAPDPSVFVREDVPGAIGGLANAHLQGLTPDAEEVECIVKFGSVSEANFRIKVGGGADA